MPKQLITSELSTSQLISLYLSNIISYRDRFSLLTNSSGDSGDSLHNMSMHYVNLSYLGTLDEYHNVPSFGFQGDLRRYRVGAGQYVRHPDLNKWYSKLKYTSRDQIKSAMSGMLYFRLEPQLREVYLELKSRNFMHWNSEESDPGPEGQTVIKIPDPVGLSQFGMFIRGLPELSGYRWLLPLLDLDYLYTSIYGYRKWDASCKQFVELIAIEKTGILNPVTKLAIKLFKRNKYAATLIEESFCVHSLQIPPLGFLLRMGFIKWAADVK